MLTSENHRGVAGGKPAREEIVAWTSVSADVDAVEVERAALVPTKCAHYGAVSGLNACRDSSAIGQSVDRYKFDGLERG